MKRLPGVALIILGSCVAPQPATLPAPVATTPEVVVAPVPAGGPAVTAKLTKVRGVEGITEACRIGHAGLDEPLAPQHA
ncbi:MAG: hypothetical protein WKG01_42720, partial [Kofleriaceae bacterium]